MARGKLKLLYLARIFEQETDDEHALTLKQIAERLAVYDIQADRKTLYQDFEDLRAFGYDILSEQSGRDTYYHLGARDFELAELKLLVDSVQAARFITERKSRELIGKLEGLVSRHQARALQRQVVIAGRVKTMNESIYYNIDRLHEAINSDARIRFQYWQWNVSGEMALRRNGRWYEVSPWALAWDDENYYLIAWDGAEGAMKHFRVDKMLRIGALKLPREGRERFEAFDMARYSRSLFGMFGGEASPVTLTGESAMVGVVIDRFGRDIPLRRIDDDHFEAQVTVALSPQFFGWVLALGGGVRITGPKPVVEEMRRMLRRAGEAYGV